jgi:hypothetical protein
MSAVLPTCLSLKKRIHEIDGKNIRKKRSKKRIRTRKKEIKKEIRKKNE